MTGNFPNLKNVRHIQVTEAFGTPNRHDQTRASPQHIITKTASTENRERILKTLREKNQITYKDKPIKITPDFSTKTLKARRAWSEEFQALKENNYSLRIPYPAELHSKLIEE
jgi:hypothetical protein